MTGLGLLFLPVLAVAVAIGAALGLRDRRKRRAGDAPSTGDP